MTAERDSTMTLEQAIAYLHPHVTSSHNADWKKKRDAWDVILDHLAARDAVVSDEDVRLFWNRIGQAHPTPQLVRDALVWFSTRMPSTAKIQPTYYVKHPDGSFSEADMTCLVVMSRSDMAAIAETMQAFAARPASVPVGWNVERGDDGESIWLRNGTASIRYWRNDGLFHWFLDDMLAQRDGGCAHEWFDATNSHVSGTAYCKTCGKLDSLSNHPEARP